MLNSRTVDQPELERLGYPVEHLVEQPRKLVGSGEMARAPRIARHPRVLRELLPVQPLEQWLVDISVLFAQSVDALSNRRVVDVEEGGLVELGEQAADGVPEVEHVQIGWTIGWLRCLVERVRQSAFIG